MKKYPQLRIKKSAPKGHLVQAPAPLPSWPFCQALGRHFSVAAQSVFGQCPGGGTFSLILNCKFSHGLFLSIILVTGFTKSGHFLVL